VNGRLGGDEFALLLWTSVRPDARAKAASLEQAVDRLSIRVSRRPVTRAHPPGCVLGLHAEAGRALEEADSAM